MNKKQIIETLESIKPSYHNVKQNSIQYAIDHLSREWVSRKTHRKLVDTLNKDRDEWQKKAIDRKNEIDQLKIEKDMLQTARETADKTTEMYFDEIKALSISLTYTQKGFEEEIIRLGKFKRQNKWLIFLSWLGFILFLVTIYLFDPQN